MSPDTQPAPLAAMAGAGLDPFRVGEPAEVLALLNELRDEGAAVHLCAADGSAYATLVWTVDAEQRRLGFSADAASPQLPALVDAGEATAVAYLRNVKLQFDLHDLMLVHGVRASALQAALPQQMYRFQRRDAFRVRTLPRTTPTAALRHPAMPEMRLSLRVLDVSMGGCALFMPDDVPPLAPGVRVHRVRIELDADTRLEATLQIQHVTALNPQSGGTRLGCTLTDLGGDGQRALQRYIDQTQKRRRLL